jgi:hypothetical protein
MEYNEQYWNDYTTFIKEVEKIAAAVGPSNLLEAYQYIVDGLETGTLLSDLYEWEPEDVANDEDGFSITICDVHKVVNTEILQKNLLYIPWTEKVTELDERMKKHLRPEYLINNEWKSWFRFKMLIDAH